MTLAPLLSALLSLAPAAPQDASADAARLVPEGCFLALRVESAEGLHALGSRIAAMGGDEVPPSAAEMLAEFDLPGDAALIDVARPVYLAVSLSGMSPAPTFIVPVRDAEAYLASLAEDPTLHSASAGGYVGVSQQSGYAVAAEGSALVTALRPGLLAAHVDLATLIETFRPMIEMGMGQIEVMMDQAALEMEEDAPMDMAALLEVYVEGIWAFLDSADQLDVTLEMNGSVAHLRSMLSTLPESPMAGFGGDESFDLRPASRWIDPDAGFSMVMAADIARTMEQFGPVMELLFDAYPPEFAAQMRRLMDAYEPIWPLLGDFTTVSGDLGPGGLRASYNLMCPDPAALTAAMNEQLAKVVTEPTDAFTIAPPVEVQLAGGKAWRSRLDIDHEALTEGLTQGQEIGEAELAQMDEFMRSIYGPDGMQMVWRPLADRLTMALGGDQAFAEAALAAAPRAYESFPAELRGAIEAASGGSTGLVYRIDYGRILADMGPVFESMGIEGLDGFSDKELRLPITFWMGVHGDDWSSGMGIDLDRLATFVGAVKEAAGDANPSDDESDD